MTLTEYINQKNPATHPTVILQEGEYEIHQSWKAGDDTFRHISIPAIWKAYGVDGYIQKNDETCLYSRDLDGNPKRMTVFHLPTTETQKVTYCHCKYPKKRGEGYCWECRKPVKKQTQPTQ